MRNALFILFVLILAVAGYWYWQNQQPSEISTPERGQEEAITSNEQDSTTSAQSDGSGVTGDENRVLESDTGDESITSADTSAENRQGIAETAIQESLEAEKREKPEIDIVRVDESGSLLIAGRAEPNSDVTVVVNDGKSAPVETDERGEFVYLSDDPLESGDYQITLESKRQGVKGESLKSEDQAIVSVRRGGADGGDKSAAFLASSEPGRDVKILQSPTTQSQRDAGDMDGTDETVQTLSIDQIDYTQDGQVRISGKGDGGMTLRLYLDNVFQKEGRVGEDGTWQFTLKLKEKDKVYTLRVDEVDAMGNVLLRAEIPYKPEVIPMDVQKERLVVVQPGNSLWRISRSIYGKGLQYTVIYEANKDQIRDPDLIYPGQVFVLPQEESTAE